MLGRQEQSMFVVKTVLVESTQRIISAQFRLEVKRNRVAQILERKTWLPLARR